MEKNATVVRDVLAAVADQLVSIADDVHHINATRLLVSRTDILVACNRKGIMHGVVTKTDIVKRANLLVRGHAIDAFNAKRVVLDTTGALFVGLPNYLIKKLPLPLRRFIANMSEIDCNSVWLDIRKFSTAYLKSVNC